MHYAFDTEGNPNEKERRRIPIYEEGWSLRRGSASRPATVCGPYAAQIAQITPAPVPFMASRTKLIIAIDRFTMIEWVHWWLLIVFFSSYKCLLFCRFFVFLLVLC